MGRNLNGPKFVRLTVLVIEVSDEKTNVVTKNHFFVLLVLRDRPQISMFF